MKPRTFSKIARVVSVLLLVGSVYGQVSVFPPSPRELETVRVQITGASLGLDVNGAPDTYDPGGTTMTMAANKIVVSLLMVGNDGFPRNPTLDWPLGQLPPGSYEVEVVKRSPNGVNQGLVGRASFTVESRAPAGPALNFTDLYWDFNEPGWGVSVTRLTSGGLFLILFVYGSDGQPRWYFVSNGEWRSPLRFRGTLHRSFGPDFLLPYDPARFQVTPVGTADISFSAQTYDVASILVTIDGVTVLKTLRRQRL